MHELSIADAVAEVARRHADGRRVARVELKVGYLRQVVPSALEFAWQLITEGTSLEQAELVIEEIPPRGRCRTCETETTMESFPLQCGRCGGLDLELLAGEELLVDALELEDDPQLEDDPLLMTGGMAHGS
jgi:hydrogenase nickel incorporation protein HypA/HybF